ncbi:MAG: NAD(P)-binding domain-containing protein [Deltaproteobacteria bacterium]|nr:NAD(P)-binding domain-containing protein [Deltaproteobacteria bacterium]MCW5802066.1 NAD(P)-binding domain-containing protein [Deltaproteobacteria bacterium]
MTRLVILGAGAIGGAIAGLLARAGREVLVIARGAHLARLRAEGLRVERPGETFVVRPPAVAAGEPIAWRGDDILVLATKTQDAAGALDELGAPAGVPVACFTNGVEAERIALRRAREVCGVAVMMPATYLEPGVVQAWAAPAPGALDLGRYPDGSGGQGVAPALAAELAMAGFDAAVRADVMRWKRGKLLSNLANGAEALCGPSARRTALFDAARAEGRACFSAAGLSCTSEEEDAARRQGYASQPIGGATRGGGSTWQSLVRGGSLEVAYLNGEISLLGRLHGVPTPINDGLARVVAEAVRAGATPGAMSVAELAARVARTGGRLAARS